jgi:cytochrome c oxidase subunit II
MHYFISPVLWQFLVKWLSHFPLFPPEASGIAPYADSFFFFLLLISVVGTGIVTVMVIASSGARCFTSAFTLRQPIP